MTQQCYKCKGELAPQDAWYGLHPACFTEWFKLSTVCDFLDLVIRSRSHAPSEDDLVSFFSGAYRKYSARLGSHHFILKIQQAEYPELPASEFLSNQIYETLNIPVPEYYLIRFPEEKPCFVTKNFMSGQSASDLVHIHHFVRERKTAYDCESLVEIIGGQTSRRTEQEKFIKLTLADSITGNHDRHGRNLGFIRSAKGVHLAPFYDNPSALGIEDHFMLGTDLQPRGCIFTKDTDKPTTRDYVQEWNRLGYGDVVDIFRKSFCLETISTLITKSDLSEKRKAAFTRLITQRGEELCNA
jgi:hypothetical protein